MTDDNRFEREVIARSTHLPEESNGWFMTLVLMTSAGVPTEAATNPLAPLQTNNKLQEDLRHRDPTLKTTSRDGWLILCVRGCTCT